MNLPAMGAILMALAVALGAFGAHGLQDRLSENALKIWHTAVLYHVIHALGMILAGLLTHHLETTLVNRAGWLMLVGIVLFSGSLYALSLSGISKLGMITPLGGLAFIIAWILLAIGCWGK